MFKHQRKTGVYFEFCWGRATCPSRGPTFQEYMSKKKKITLSPFNCLDGSYSTGSYKMSNDQ